MAPLLIGYALTLLFFLGLPWSRRRNPSLRTDEVRTRRTSSVLGIVHLSALLLPVTAALTRAGPRVAPAVAWAAVALMVSALLLQRWAQRLLSNYFTLALQSAANQPICRDGPYRWIRHPAYLAQILLWTALGLSSRNIVATAAIGVLAIAGYSYRIREEEQMLTATLGERYETYSATTKRLIPLLW